MLNIDELIKSSLKNKDTVALKVYRNLKSDIMAFKTQKNAPEYTRAVEQNLIKKYVAKMEDAEKQYLEAGREDLATECREELEVLKQWLPAPATAQDVYSILAGWCANNEFINEETEQKLTIPKKSMGTAIKAMKEVFPTADGKMISDIVKQYVV
jgi:uncharacterized protein YqeY